MLIDNRHTSILIPVGAQYSEVTLLRSVEPPGLVVYKHEAPLELKTKTAIKEPKAKTAATIS